MSEKPNLISLKEEIPATTFVHWANLTVNRLIGMIKCLNYHHQKTSC